jgi:localization factor PodJL
MRKAIPWGVRGGGVDAREAARREGMSLSEWLAQTVGQYAAEAGTDPANLDEDDCAEAIAARLRRLGVKTKNPHDRHDKPSSPRAESLFGRGAKSAKRKDASRAIEETLLQKAFARLEDGDDFDMPPLHAERLDPEFVEARLSGAPRRASLGNAIAEIARRQRDLEEESDYLVANGGARGRESYDHATLTELRSEIAALAAQVQGLRREQAERIVAPPAACNLDKLRSEIGAMSDSLRDLAARGSLAPLEATIRNLTQQIEASRSDGIREAVLQPLERLIGEIRVALAEADPRTTIRGLEGEVKKLEVRLVPVERLERQVEALNERFDRLREFAEHRVAPERREEAELDAVARELRVLTGDAGGGGAFAKIENQLADIAAKVEQALAEAKDETRYTALANRITDVHRELADRMSQGLPQIDVHGLEPLVRQLAQKIEEAHGPQADSRAIEALQRQVSEFAARLDRTNAGFGSLSSLEQSITDLFGELEKTRDVSYATAEKAARAALDQARSGSAGPPEFAQNLVELRAMQDEAGRRTLTTLNAVHETLEKVVDRLALVENEIADVRGGQRPAEMLASGPAPNFAPAGRMPPPFATTKMPAFGDDDDKPMPQAEMLDNFLIEPGRGFPGSRNSSADDDAETKPGRKAADARDKNDPANGRAGFIAAARRAAQAAQMESAVAIGRTPKRGLREDTSAGLIAQTRSFIAQHKRPVVLSIAALFLAVGAYAVVKTVGHSSLLDPATINGKDQAPAHSMPSHVPPNHVAPNPVSPRASLENPTAGNTLMSPQAMLQPDPIATGAIGPKPQEFSHPAKAQDASISVLQTLAHSGNAKAQYELATDYTIGRGVARDLDIAAQLFEKAAAQGLVPAEYRLGTLYEKGIGVRRDSDQAMSWYHTAADHGNVRAMHNLGVLTAEGGDNSKPNYADAAQWFRKAAEYGVRDSQYNVAILLARGLGVQQNLSLSYVWFAIAANQGDDDAGKKRDDVAARLSAADLAAAKAMAAAFHPKTPDPAANDVAPPPGGWVAPASNASKAHPKLSRL